MASNVNRKRLHFGTKKKPGCGNVHHAGDCPLKSSPAQKDISNE